MLFSCVFCSLLAFPFCSLVILSKWLLCYSCNHRHNILLIHSLVNSFYQFYLQNFQQMLLFTLRHSQKSHFQRFLLLQMRLTDAMLLFLVLPTYIHGGRFPCRKESETSPPKKQESRACFMQTALLSYFGFTSLSHLLFLNI